MGKELFTDTNDNGGYWSLPLAGFANPRYVNGATQGAASAAGFSIAGAGMLVLAFENGHTATVVHEQTMDPTGAAGWFPVVGALADNPSAAPASAAVSGKAYFLPALGVRHRVRVIALTVADLRMRGYLSDDPFALPSSLASVSTAGSIAEDAVATGANPVGIGLEARNTQKASMSATGDLVRAAGTMDGRQVVVANAIPELTWQYAGPTLGIVNSAASVPIKAAGAAGIRNYLSSIQISHDVLGAATEFIVADGATVIHRQKVQTPATEGQVIKFDPPLKGTAATALNVFCLAAVTGGIFVNAQGFTGP